MPTEFDEESPLAGRQQPLPVYPANTVRCSGGAGASHEASIDPVSVFHPTRATLRSRDTLNLTHAD